LPATGKGRTLRKFSTHRGLGGTLSIKEKTLVALQCRGDNGGETGEGGEKEMWLQPGETLISSSKTRRGNNKGGTSWRRKTSVKKKETDGEKKNRGARGGKKGQNRKRKKKLCSGGGEQGGWVRRGSRGEGMNSQKKTRKLHVAAGTKKGESQGAPYQMKTKKERGKNRPKKKKRKKNQKGGRQGSETT